MATNNGRLWAAFDDERIQEALVGSEDLFTPEYTSRTHDRLWVIRQLLAWAAGRDRAEEATASFVAAVRRRIEQTDAATAVDLVWSYLIVTKDTSPLPIDTGVLRQMIEGVVDDLTPALSDDSRSPGRGDPPNDLRYSSAHSARARHLRQSAATTHPCR